MKRIVLSAFGVFGDYLANPAEIAANLLRHSSIAGYYVEAFVLKANIPFGPDRGMEILRFAETINANGIISLGMASEKTGFCIESVAANLVSNAKYCQPSMNNKSITPNVAKGEKILLDLTPWNTVRFQRDCRGQGIPVMPISRDAGGFCCNHLMWQVRYAQSQGVARKRPFMFMHVPCCTRAVPDKTEFVKAGKVTMEPATLIKGLEILLENALI